MMSTGKPRMFVPDDRKIWALAELENGRTVPEVAAELGVSMPTVYNWRRYFAEYGRFSPTAADLRDRQDERRAKLEAAMSGKSVASYSYEDRVQIVTAYEDGDLSAREIRERYGVQHAELLAWRELVAHGDVGEVSEVRSNPVAWSPATSTTVHEPAREHPEPHPDTGALARSMAECERLRAELASAKRAEAVARREAAQRAADVEAQQKRLDSHARDIARVAIDCDRATKRADLAEAAVVDAEQRCEEHVERVKELEAERVKLRAEVHDLRNQLQAAEGAAPSALEAALRAEIAKLKDRVKVLAGMVHDA